MIRISLVMLGYVLLAVAAPADETKGAKVPHTVYDAYFEKNDSGLKGDTSYLAFTDQDGFDKVFAARPPLMGGMKPILLPKDAFDKQFVAAVITRGNSTTTYEVEQVTLHKDGALHVHYKSTAGRVGSARFASPLIISAPMENVKKVVFIANGKPAGTVEVK